MTPIPIEIVWTDGFIAVQPTFPDALKAKLSYWRRVSVVERFQRKLINKHEELYEVMTYTDPDEPGVVKHRLVTMDGFLNRVRRFLQDEGWPVTITDKRTPRPAPDAAAAFIGLRLDQQPAVWAAVYGGGGVIAAATGFGKTHVTAGIIRAYSPAALKLRGTPLTIFAAPERDINAKNYVELKKILEPFGRKVGIMQSGTKVVNTDDVMCVTLDSLPNFDPTLVGVFICDEVHTGVSDSRSASIQDMTRAMKFGVSATPSGRYDGKDLVIEGLFGPVVFRKTYQAAVADGTLVPIKVLWFEAPEPDLGLRYYNDLRSREGKYRNAVDHNSARNRLIGNILGRIPDTLQTVAIMPHIEQMNQLRPLCPDSVRVVHAETRAESLATRKLSHIPAISQKQRKQIYDAMRDGDIRKILATYVYKQGVDFPKLAVMINAGGGGSEIASKQIPGRVSRNASGKECAFLIDFKQPWDWQTNKAGKKVPGPVQKDDLRRAKFYKDLGFEQVTLRNLDELGELLDQYDTQTRAMGTADVDPGVGSVSAPDTGLCAPVHGHESGTAAGADTGSAATN